MRTIIVMATFTLTACGQAAQNHLPKNIPDSGVSIYRDEERKVTCYIRQVYAGNAGANVAMSCVKD